MQEALVAHAVDMGLAHSPPPTSMATPDFPPECAEVVQALWEIVDGEVSADDDQRFRKHLDECHYCRSHEEFEVRLVREISELRSEFPQTLGLRRRVRELLAETASPGSRGTESAHT